MLFSRSALLAGLVFVASAQALPRFGATKFVVKTNAAMNYTWSVTNWDGSCATSGCYYDFNVSAAAHGSNAPAFSAYCSGGPEGAAFDQCEILDAGTSAHAVAAKLLATNTTGTGAHLAVSYEFVDLVAEDTIWNYTAYTTTTYNQLVSAPLNFTLIPSEVWGAA